MPRIEMTRTVRLALCCLRVYLIVLLALIVLKFVMTFTDPNRDSNAAGVLNHGAVRRAE